MSLDLDDDLAGPGGDTLPGPAFAVTQGCKLKGSVEAVLRAPGVSAERQVPQGERYFLTERTDALPLTFGGVADDVHEGLTRPAGSREPWYERGTPMRNERQVTIVSLDEMAEVARLMRVDRVEPEWIGANMVLAGLPHLSMLPPRTLLFFEGGVTLKVDGDNAPCRLAGRAIAAHHPGRDDLELAFPLAARHRRGLVAWVERPGTVRAGEAVTARVPPQWIYDP